MAFTLNPRLAAGGFELATKFGCRILLKNNSLFPWMIVVPEEEGAVEDLHQLPMERYLEVMKAVRLVSEFVETHFRPEKLNVGCIGNQVRQMHIQIIGRSTGDPCWPGVVWAFEGKKVYEEADVASIREAAAAFFA